MDSITLENFINYCDNMQIVNEGLLSKKLTLNKDLFDLSNVPEDRKSDAESVIDKILSNIPKYTQLTKDILDEEKFDTKKIKLVPIQKEKVYIADSDSSRSIELKNGTKGYLGVKKGDITLSITLAVNPGMFKENIRVEWIFVNDKILTPLHLYTLR